MLGNSFSGHGEYGISTHLLLTITGLPLSLLSWHLPNGSALGVLAAGLIGTIQWSVVAEANARWELRRLSRSLKQTSFLSPRATLGVLWVAALSAPLFAGYALSSAVTYAWLNASGSWSAQRASFWFSVASISFCVFSVISVVAIVRLIRYYNHLPRRPDRDEVHNQ